MKQKPTREQRRRRSRRTLIALTYLCLFLAWLLSFLATPACAEPEHGPPVQVIRQDLKPEPLEENENERIEAALLENAVKLENVTVSHYCTCVMCCGKDNGITASGRIATPGVSVAVDPSVIPLGSDVLVDYGDGEIHYMRADDVGGAIKGAHIDVCVKDHQTAISEGVKTATVYWISPEAFK